MAGEVIIFVKLTLLSLVPYALSSQGVMIGGRTGVFNVAGEGIMLVGAVVGFLGAYLSGSLWIGILLAILTGGLFGLVMAYFSTTLKMNQFVIGLALFIFGLGLATLLYKLVIGVTLKPPLIARLADVPIPLLSQIPILGEALFSQNLIFYFTVIISVLLHVLLYKTRVGREIRSVGENPMAADSLGVNVFANCYATAIIGGMLMGIAGAYLPIAYTSTFTEGIVGGRGWVAIALTFFGFWRPLPILLGSLFFATVEVVSFRAQVVTIGIPYQFLTMIPYIATILVMMAFYGRAKTPAYLGRNYDREKRGI